jgi:hypothetical protein
LFIKVPSLTISPEEASGLAAFVSARFAFEKYVYDDFGFFGALGSFFFLPPGAISAGLVPALAFGESSAKSSSDFGGRFIALGGCF